MTPRLVVFAIEVASIVHGDRTIEGLLRDLRARGCKMSLGNGLDRSNLDETPPWPGRELDATASVEETPTGHPGLN